MYFNKIKVYGKNEEEYYADMYEVSAEYSQYDFCDTIIVKLYKLVDRTIKLPMLPRFRYKRCAKYEFKKRVNMYDFKKYIIDAVKQYDDELELLRRIDSGVSDLKSWDGKCY